MRSNGKCCVVAGVTVIRAVHLTELRARVDAVRARVGLTAFAYTDPSLTAGATMIKAQHLLDLRAALAAVYTTTGRAQPTYTDPSLTTGTTMKVAHTAELRAAVVALE